ncbi:MAG: PD40 domain-containing protein, partial [Acidobacteria bacterium]|nr:PD40 domain-containing protein [Acidobacteriota bacterium]
YRLSVQVSIEDPGQEAETPFTESSELVTESGTDEETFVEKTPENGDRKGVNGKEAHFTRKMLIFSVAGSLIVLSSIYLSYRVFRQKIWLYSHPPLENVQFQRLTDSGNVEAPAISPDGNLVAFVRKHRIVLKDIKSGRDIELDIPNITSFGQLQFSHDGESIYFRNTRIRLKVGNVMQVSRFGGEAKIIAEKTWITFSVSPDGKSIAFIRNISDQKNHVLYIKDLHEGGERKLLSRSIPVTFFNRGNLSWSPDGKKIAFIANAGAERSTKLFVADAVTGEETEISNPRLRRYESADWLPDGENLVVAASEVGGNKFQLWKVTYPDGYAQRISSGLSSFGRVSVSAQSSKIAALQTVVNSNIWTARGEDLASWKQITEGNSRNVGQTSIDWVNNDKIVYTSAEEKAPFSNLWLIDPDDNTRLPLTSNSDFHSDYAKPTQDGKYIYFNSNRNRLINIWRIDSTGENLTQIVSKKDGLRLFPTPSPDGKYLYYLFRDRTSAAIRRLKIADGKEETFFDKKGYSPAAFVSLSRDGNHLAFMNLTNDFDEEDRVANFQIVVVSTQNTDSVKSFNIKTTVASVRFSPDSNSFDYVSNIDGETKILRQDLIGGEPSEILTLPNERIFNFAWSNDGSGLAVSRGHRSQDIVLLSNLD